MTDLPHRYFSRLAIGPLNQASQANAWANAVSLHSDHDAFSFAQDGALSARLRGVRIKDKAQSTVPHHRLTPKWVRAKRIDGLLRGVSHLLNESNSSILGDPRNEKFCDEVPQFEARGVQLAIVFHGSDIRDPQRHMDLNTHSYFKDAPRDWVARLSAAVARNQACVSELNLPIYVSTPDLLMDLPHATLLPLSIDTAQWSSSEAIFSRPRPRVLHQPSRSHPPIKGSQYIDPVLRKLDADGLIEYVRAASVPHSQMQSIVSSVDVVVDQIQTGSYGVAAIEAMAAGRVVVGDVSAFAATAVGGDVPICNANPANFSEVMLDLLSHPDEMRDLALKGRTFVEQWHDGGSSSRAIQGFLSA